MKTGIIKKPIINLKKGDVFSCSRQFNSMTKWEVIRVCIKHIKVRSTSFVGYDRIYRNFKFEDYNDIYVIE